MVAICEFEFFDSDGYVIAVPLGFEGEGTFGTDLNDAVAMAADWLASTLDDYNIAGNGFPPPTFGHKPENGGKVIAIAVSRELDEIPSMTASDAARELGVSRARVSQLIKAGLLESWRSGTKRLVSVESVKARKEDAPKPGRPSCELVSS